MYDARFAGEWFTCPDVNGLAHVGLMIRVDGYLRFRCFAYGSSEEAGFGVLRIR